MPKPTVLVVDDIEGVHEMLDIILGDAGYQVEHAMNGREALITYREQPIDVIFTDIEMPGMSGLDLLRTLRELDEDAVVIMTTAISSKHYAIQALRLGAFDYVEKPYDEDALTATMDRAIKHRRKLVEVDDKNTSNPGTRRELERLRHDLKARESELANLGRKAQELEERLHQREEELKDQKDSQRSLNKRQQDLELREGALSAMDETLKERMQALKKMQKERQSGGELTPEAEQALNRLRKELEAREAELEQMQLTMSEREQFLRESEESLLEKGQLLTEMEAELEQMREDLDQRQRSNQHSPEDLKHIESLKGELASKQSEIQEAEEALNRREEAVRRASALLKAREQFLQESEDILFGVGKE